MLAPLFVPTLKMHVVLVLCRRRGLDLLLWSCFSISVLRLLLPHEASVLGSVVGATAAALHPQHVESRGGVGLAVIAYDL